MERRGGNTEEMRIKRVQVAHGGHGDVGLMLNCMLPADDLLCLIVFIILDVNL